METSAAPFGTRPGGNRTGTLTGLEIRKWIKADQHCEACGDGDGLYLSYRECDAVQQAAEIHRLATRAVRKAQAGSRRMGVANVCSRDGRLYCDAEELTDKQDDSGRGQ